MIIINKTYRHGITFEAVAFDSRALRINDDVNANIWIRGKILSQAVYRLYTVRKSTPMGLIMRTYYWPGISKDVRRYVRSCHKCLRAKIVRNRPFRYLKPLPIGERLWSAMAMDHIVKLPKSNGYDAILVVVCRLTKMAVFIPCYTTDTSSDLAKQFMIQIS